MRAVLASLALLFLLPTTACSVYFGGGDDDDDCYYGAAEADGAAYSPIRLIDPTTLACVDFGGYGGGCDDLCGPCPDYDQAPLPSWGECDSMCSYLDESTCVETPSCRAAYDYGCYTNDGPCTAELPYAGCYAVDYAGPTGGDCASLDAWGCSTRDDCIALHDFSTGSGAFVQCAAEGAACETLGDEAACLARGDCSPRYEGTDCTCDPGGNCTCETWTYQDCITGRDDGTPPPAP